MKKLLAGVILLGALVSTQSQARSPIVTEDIEVSFFSIGSGIDRKALSTARQIIGNALSKGDVLSYKKTGWGMEGETILCVRMLPDGNYLDILKKGLANGRYMHVSLKNFEECGKSPIED